MAATRRSRPRSPGRGARRPWRVPRVPSRRWRLSVWGSPGRRGVCVGLGGRGGERERRERGGKERKRGEKDSGDGDVSKVEVDVCLLAFSRKSDECFSIQETHLGWRRVLFGKKRPQGCVFQPDVIDVAEGGSCGASRDGRGGRGPERAAANNRRWCSCRRRRHGVSRGRRRRLHATHAHGAHSDWKIRPISMVS